MKIDMLEQLMLFFRLFFFLLFSLSLSADNLAIITSDDSNINYISKKQLCKIFLGKTKRVLNGDEVTVYELVDKTLQNEFYEMICNKNQKQLKKYWAKLIFTGRAQPPKKFDSIKDLLLNIKQNKNSISYIPKSSINKDLKILLEIE